MTRRRALVLVAFAAVVLVAVALATVDIEVPAFGRTLLERASAITGGRITADRVTLRLVRGFVLHGVKAEVETPAGPVAATMEELVFEPRWLPLLRGQVEITRVRLRRPHVTLRAAAAKPPPAPTVAAPMKALHLRELRIEEGRLVLDGTSVEDVDLRVDDVTLSAPGLRGLSASGRVQAARISAGTAVTDASATFRIASGVLRSDDLAFTVPEGRLRAVAEVQLARNPLTYVLTLEGTPLDLNASAPPGGRFGAAALRFTGRGSGLGAEGLTGSGTVRLERGTLPGTPLLAGLERALGRTRIVGAAYEPAEVRYRIAQRRVTFEPFVLRAPPMEVQLAGWTELGGRVDVAAVARVPASGVQMGGLSALVLGALSESDGRVAVPLRVTGVRPQVTVRPDVAAMAAQAGRSGGSRARDILRGLGRRVFGN